jgi:tetratricopeptide (TPR) repeat protein
MRGVRAALLGALVLAATAQAPAHAPLAQAHHAVSAANPDAQAAFDRGLAFLYAFNVGEARTQFAAAANADPLCAMAYWGEAIAETIDINLPDTAEGDQRGTTAIARALALRARTTPEEAALIDALAKRYARRGTTAAHFRAYADAMDAVAAAYPSDPDALTLAAYARWNAVDDLLTPSRAPVPGALAIERDVDAALALDPANIGAHHLRIHIEEEIGHPERALSDARYFDGLTFVPGMSHLPHMAGHIYARTGDYAALVAANERAVANDAAYFALGNGPGQAYMRTYHDHDLDFIAYGLTTLGRDADARDAVAHEDTRMQLRVALRTRDVSAVDLADAVKNDPLRAIALARAGRLAEADAVVATFPTQATGDALVLPTIARAIVDRVAGRYDEAVSAYRAALQLRGNELGDPKFAWPYPPGEGLGAVLLQQGKYAEAESVFRRELTDYPNDPRLAFGLAEAQRAQNEDDTDARAIVKREWQGPGPLTEIDLE